MIGIGIGIEGGDGAGVVDGGDDGAGDTSAGTPEDADDDAGVGEDFSGSGCFSGDWSREGAEFSFSALGSGDVWAFADFSVRNGGKGIPETTPVALPAADGVGGLLPRREDGGLTGDTSAAAGLGGGSAGFIAGSLLLAGRITGVAGEFPAGPFFTSGEGGVESAVFGLFAAGGTFCFFPPDSLEGLPHSLAPSTGNKVGGISIAAGGAFLPRPDRLPSTCATDTMDEGREVSPPGFFGSGAEFSFVLTFGEGMPSEMICVGFFSFGFGFLSWDEGGGGRVSSPVFVRSVWA